MEGRAQANITHRSLLPNLQGSRKKLNPVILKPHHVSFTKQPVLSFKFNISF
jgi:hypothetical protein